MSVRNGRPRGRVVIVSGGCVRVIPRRSLASVFIDDHPSGGEVSWLFVGDGGVWTEEQRESSYDSAPNVWSAPDLAKLYRSIVDEDADVIWSREDGGWVRVPDVVE